MISNNVVSQTILCLSVSCYFCKAIVVFFNKDAFLAFVMGNTIIYLITNTYSQFSYILGNEWFHKGDKK